MSETTEMTVRMNKESFDRAILRISVHLMGKRVQLLELDSNGDISKNCGEDYFERCTSNPGMGTLTIILKNRKSLTRVLWPDASPAYPVVLHFLANGLRITDANKSVFEYRFVR